MYIFFSLITNNSVSAVQQPVADSDSFKSTSSTSELTGMLNVIILQFFFFKKKSILI